MTGQILENLRHDRYLAKPELLDRLQIQFQKCYDYVKEFVIKNQNGGQIAATSGIAPNQNPSQTQGHGQTQNQNQSQPFSYQQSPPQQQQPPILQSQPHPPQQQFLHGQSQMMGATNAPATNMLAMQNIPQSVPQGQVSLHQMNLMAQLIRQQPQQSSQQFGNGSMGGVGPGVSQMAPAPVAGVAQQMPSAGSGGFNEQWPRSLPQMEVKRHTPVVQSQQLSQPQPGSTPGQHSQSWRKNGNKGPINAASIPTPAGLAPLPNAMTAMRTPNLIPTPHIGLHSNKNTPQMLSPQIFKNTPLSQQGDEIFSHLPDDVKLARRRELLSTDPERFFYASLANLLELDEPLEKGENSGMNPGKLSPLSPALTEWTCEIKLEALTLLFRQVPAIRSLAQTDIIDTCSKLAVESAKRPALSAFDDDIDTLFGEKKTKLEDFDKFLHETVGFEDWKLFVVSSIQ